MAAGRRRDRRVAGQREENGRPAVIAARPKPKRARSRRKPGAVGSVWLRIGIEVGALLSAALVGVIALLGYFADWFIGIGWLHLLPFAGAVLGLGLFTALLLWGWIALRRRLVRYATW